MSVTPSPSQDRPYGVTLVCKAWEIPRSTFYDARDRRRHGSVRAKPGPKPELSDEQLAAEIQALLTETEELFGIRGGYGLTLAFSIQAIASPRTAFCAS